MSTKFSGSQVCLRDLTLVAYLCSNTYPRFTTSSYKDMHTTVHAELYSNCIFNSTHHQGLKEQVCQKISPSHSVIFNSDLCIMPLTVIKELTVMRPPNLWNLSAEDFPIQVTPQTPGWGVTKCDPPGTLKLNARTCSTCSLPGSILLNRSFFSIITT